MPEGSSSLVNEREAEMVLQVYRELRHRHADLASKPSVAVISPYKAQVGTVGEEHGLQPTVWRLQSFSSCRT